MPYFKCKRASVYSARFLASVKCEDRLATSVSYFCSNLLKLTLYVLEMIVKVNSSIEMNEENIFSLKHLWHLFRLLFAAWPYIKFAYKKLFSKLWGPAIFSWLLPMLELLIQYLKDSYNLVEINQKRLSNFSVLFLWNYFQKVASATNI